VSNYIPKIRIRVPKWQAIRSASWAKELLMTFIGATLSIILTFGTAHFVDQKQQREDGRQTAMMVIHDMENTAKLFREYVKEEEKNFNVAQHVLANVNQLDVVSSDTIVLFASYITAGAGQLYNYDNSSEKIFLSSQEAWKTINNPSFIDAVQTFFHSRQLIYDNLNNDRLYARPISNGEYYNLLLTSPDMQELDTAFWVNYTKEFVRSKAVARYIDFSYVRRRYCNEYADQFMSIANKCKFMMGITDEELAQYVQNRERTGKPLKAKNLIGDWRVQTADDLYSDRHFDRDHTFTTQINQYMSYSFYTGQIVLKCTLHGIWDLQGDSLFTSLTPGYSYEFDKSAIRYQPEMEGALNELLEVWEQSVIAQLESLTKKEGESRHAAFASIDATGNKIELREVNEGVIYLTRFDKP
jgi:hypothetical protein